MASSNSSRVQRPWQAAQAAKRRQRARMGHAAWWRGWGGLGLPRPLRLPCSPKSMTALGWGRRRRPPPARRCRRRRLRSSVSSSNAESRSRCPSSRCAPPSSPSRHLFLLPLLFLLLDTIHQFDCRQRPLSLPHRRHPEPQAGEEEALKREGRSAG